MYFKVTLKDGSILDFDKRCNVIESFDNSNVCCILRFLDTYTTLAIIPVENIFMIIREEGE